MIPLETPRLQLRDLRDTDFDAVHAYASDPAVVKYTSFGPNSEDQTRAFLNACPLESEAVPRRAFNLAVIERGSQHLIGGCGVLFSDATDQQLALGYCLRREAWRQGYGKEAAAALTRFGFEVLGAHRIWALLFKSMTRAGRLRQENGLGFPPHPKAGPLF